MKKDKFIKYEKYISDLSEALKCNKRASIIKYIYNRTIKDNNTNQKEKFLKKCIKLWEKLEKMINEKKYIDIHNNENKQILIDYFFDENNKDSLLNIFKKDIYDDFVENFKLNEKIQNPYENTQNLLEINDSSKNDIINRLNEDNNNIKKNNSINRNEYKSKASNEKEISFSLSNNSSIQ